MTADRAVAIVSILFALMGSAIPAEPQERYRQLRVDRHFEEQRFTDCYVPCLDKSKKK